MAGPESERAEPQSASPAANFRAFAAVPRPLVPGAPYQHAALADTTSAASPHALRPAASLPLQAPSSIHNAMPSSGAAINRAQEPGLTPETPSATVVVTTSPPESSDEGATWERLLTIQRLHREEQAPAKPASVALPEAPRTDSAVQLDSQSGAAARPPVNPPIAHVGAARSPTAESRSAAAEREGAVRSQAGHSPAPSHPSPTRVASKTVASEPGHPASEQPATMTSAESTSREEVDGVAPASEVAALMNVNASQMASRPGAALERTTGQQAPVTGARLRRPRRPPSGRSTHTTEREQPRPTSRSAAGSQQPGPLTVELEDVPTATADGPKLQRQTEEEATVQPQPRSHAELSGHELRGARPDLAQSNEDGLPSETEGVLEGLPKQPLPLQAVWPVRLREPSRQWQPTAEEPTGPAKNEVDTRPARPRPPDSEVEFIVARRPAWFRSGPPTDTVSKPNVGAALGPGEVLPRETGTPESSATAQIAGAHDSDAGARAAVTSSTVDQAVPRQSQAPHVQRNMGDTPADAIETEIGLLPRDLWQLLDQPPPEPTTHTPFRADSGGSRAVQMSLSPPQAASAPDEFEKRALPPMSGMAMQMRTDNVSQAGTGAGAEAVPGEAAEDTDLDELALRVYAEIRRRLALERENNGFRF